VPAERRRQGQRRLEVDAAARTELTEGGQAEGLPRGVGRERVVGQLDRRQADTVDGDAVARARLGEIQALGRDAQPQVAAAGLERAQRADVLDDASEQSLSPAARRPAPTV
jgi:hypothetical protein